MRRGFPISLLPCLLLAGACAGTTPPVPAGASGAGPAGDPDQNYYVYVGAESADLLHRIRFGPGGTEVVATTPVGEIPVETEGPHGFNTSPDGRYVYMTTGHGVPDGKLWKLEAGPDTSVAEPILLGWFPATLDVTPDGLYVFVANFNLHGDHVPSTVSVVYTPQMMEVKQIETCVMPHGLRVAPDGLHAYSNCMMDDLMVEIDTRTFEVSRLISVARGAEGPVEATAHGAHAGHGQAGAGGMAMAEPTCSPTWAEPSPDGSRVYVACNKGDWILELDRDSGELLRTLPTSRRGPYNLEVTPDGSTLVATLKPSAAVEVFDLETGESRGVVESTTTIPHGVVASPDSRYAFVSVEGVGAEPGKVDVIDLATVTLAGSVEVGQQAGGITFWKTEPATAGADRPERP